MMQEALVLLACYNNNGCLEATSTYKHYNPEIYHESSKIIENISKNIPNWTITYIFPTIAVISRQKAVLRLDKHFSTEVTSESMAIKFNFEF